MWSKRNVVSVFILLALVLVAGWLIRRDQTAGVPPVVLNPGFEPGDGTEALAGWSSTGIAEAEAHSGETRLTHPGGSGPVETRQAFSDIPNGWYTLRVWVRSSGGQSAAYAALTDCGSEEARVDVPIVRKDRWLQIVVSAKVTRHVCTISLHSEAGTGEWVSFDDVELASGRAALTVMGADISSLKKSEDMGGVYAYEDGTEADALEVLSEHGMNYARIRVWVDSPDGYHGLEEMLEIARRLKQNHIQLLVDFHYSDVWADPGKQIKPAAWESLDPAGLEQAVYDHTFDVCQALKKQGTPPDMIQVGNEINNGMLWPDGKASNWDTLAVLLKAGYRAVKVCSPSTLVMLHIAEGGDNDLARWWFDSAVEREVPFDVIGISYYPFWHGSLADLQVNLNDIALRYDKDLIVVETAYPFTVEEDDGLTNIIRFQTSRGYDATPEGQLKMMADVMTVVRAVPNGHGLGIFYWDATWTAVPGNGWDPAHTISGNAWENQALFDYENRPLPAMSLFGRP